MNLSDVVESHLPSRADEEFVAFIELITRAVIFVISLVGMPTSALVLFVSAKLSAEGSYSRMVLIESLAVVDFFGLLIKGVWNTSMVALKAYHPNNMNLWMCKGTAILTATTSILTGHLTTLLSFDRFVAIVLPVQYGALWTPGRAKGAVFLASLESFLMTIPTGFLMRLDGECIFDLSSSKILALIYLVTFNVGFFGLSLLLTLVFSLAAILKNNNKSAVMRERPQNKFHRALTAVCLAFLLLNGSALLLIWGSVLAASLSPQLSLIIQNFISIPLCLNHSVNFFLLFYGSRTFNQRFRRIFQKQEDAGRQ